MNPKPFHHIEVIQDQDSQNDGHVIELIKGKVRHLDDQLSASQSLINLPIGKLSLKVFYDISMRMTEHSPRVSEARAVGED